MSAIGSPKKLIVNPQSPIAIRGAAVLLLKAQSIKATC